MPQIPLTRKPQLLRSGANAVPLSGAPGLGWRTNNGMQQLAEGLSDFSRGVSRMGNDFIELAERKQRADDADALGQIGLVNQTSTDDLYTRMRENPNAYEEFDTWEQEATGALSDKVKPYLEKLSPEARKRADLDLAMAAEKRKAQARAISFQADVTAKRGNYDLRIRHYAKTGDVAAAAEQLRQAEEIGVFSPNERESYTNFIGEIADFGAAERRIDSGDPEIVEALQEREESGAPKEYKALSEESRKQLLRYAGQKRNVYEIDQRAAFVADVQAGKSIDEESILKRTDIRQDVKNDFVKILRDTQKAKTQQLSAEQAAERKTASDAFEYRLLETKWPADPVERDNLYNKLDRQIYTDFAKDEPGYAATLKRQLNESRKAAEKPDSSYKKSAAYQYGSSLIDQMKAQGRFYAGLEEGWIWDSKKKDKETVGRVEALVKLDLDNYLRAHPDAPEEKVRAHIEQMTADYNKTKVDDLADRSVIHRQAIPSRPSEGRTGLFNGRKVIYKNGAWTYAE